MKNTFSIFKERDESISFQASWVDNAFVHPKSFHNPIPIGELAEWLVEHNITYDKYGTSIFIKTKNAEQVLLFKLRWL